MARTAEASGSGALGASAQTAPERRRAALRGHAAMLAFALTISVSFTLGKRAVPHLSPEAITAARFLVACLVIGALALPALRIDHLAGLWRYGVIGGLFAAYFVLMFEALSLTDPVSVAAIFTLTPAMSAGFGWLLLGQRASVGMLCALALGAAGALWVVFRGDLAALLAVDLGPGEWLFLLGCLAHAAYTPLTKKLSRGEPAPVFAFGALAAGLLVTLAWGGSGVLRTDWASLPPVAIAAVLYLGLAATALTFLLTRFAAARLPSGKVMAYGYLVPVFVILWEGMLTGNWVALPVWLGVVATIGALAMLLVEHDR
ncbi:MAG: DMT family transporter [Pseudomonadota bacterium]